MNKLTDIEIVKAFQKTFEQYKEKGDCRTAVYKEILDLINRQNAEMKSLTEKLEVLGDLLQDAQYKIAEQQAEIERFKSIRDNRAETEY